MSILFSIEQLLYYTENYGTKPKTMKLWLTM